VEFVPQELRQALFDLLGLGSWSGEPEERVIGLCRLRDYADRGVNVLASWLVLAAGAA
jgi:hypothetical protein